MLKSIKNYIHQTTNALQEVLHQYEVLVNEQVARGNLSADEGLAKLSTLQKQLSNESAALKKTPQYLTLNDAEKRDILAQIDEFKPHVLFVGMGMPRQEAWLLDHAQHLPPCVTFSVGAAFDYEAGVQRAAPRWMGRVGVEWLFRLAHDPRRLFARYCIEPWSLVPVIMADIVTAIRAGRLFRAPKPLPRGFVPRADGRQGELNQLID